LNLKVKGERVLVLLRLEATAKPVGSGKVIFMPESKDGMTRAEVVAVGDGVKDSEVKKGDKVFIKGNTGYNLELDGRTFTMLPYDSIIGLEEDN